MDTYIKLCKGTYKLPFIGGSYGIQEKRKETQREKEKKRIILLNMLEWIIQTLGRTIN